MLIDPDDEGEVRYGQQAYDQQPTGEGVYKTKKKVKGEELFRKNVEVKLLRASPLAMPTFGKLKPHDSSNVFWRW